MKKMFRGFCPVQKHDYSILVDYIDISTFDEGIRHLKGLFVCEYNSFGNKCNVSKCPIMQSAPEVIEE